jgi:hypothetical protein
MVHSQTQGPAGWRELSAPPLSGRVESMVAGVGDTIVVAGGWDWLCPPDADCVSPNTPPFVDGAAYDLNTEQWRSISDAPVGLRATVNAVLGDDIYVLSRCDGGTTCPAGQSLLRYRSQADEWDLLPAPADMRDYGLVAVEGGVVAYSQSDERESKPDYRFLAGEDRWLALPNDPMPPVYDRFAVEYAGALMLFGTPIGGDNTKLGAAYDPSADTWEELAASGTLGFQVWRAGPSLYLNPHFRGAGGGVYDPELDQWLPLVDAPYHDLAGVIGSDEASYAYAAGWVLDTRSGEWLEIEPRPGAEGVYDALIAPAADLRMVVWGGQTWASGEGQLLNDTWVWSPPPLATASR